MVFFFFFACEIRIFLFLKKKGTHNLCVLFCTPPIPFSCFVFTFFMLLFFMNFQLRRNKGQREGAPEGVDIDRSLTGR